METDYKTRAEILEATIVSELGEGFDKRIQLEDNSSCYVCVHNGHVLLSPSGPGPEGAPGVLGVSGVSGRKIRWYL